MSVSSRSSAALLAAQEKLNRLRDEVRARRFITGSPVVPEIEVTGQRVEVPDTFPVGDYADNGVLFIQSLPAHLGWGSRAVTAVIRASQNRRQQEASCHVPAVVQVRDTAVTPPVPSDHNGFIKLYPDIGLGMLRQELAAPGRIWLLLRHLDTKGRGSLRIDVVVRQLSTKNSSLYLCGRRQWRNLLRQGDGVFWQRDKECIWLRSATKVAHALGVARLTGKPVSLPVSAVLQGIGLFRAHLYASFHSGRVQGQRPDTEAMPIARSTLTTLSGVGRRSQRAYEQRLKINVKENYAVGETANLEQTQARAWQQGRATFSLKDYTGQQGKQGRTYLAWQLPNSYRGCHEQRPKGRQKRINRELKDLVMKGMPGNVEETIERQYFANGARAARHHGRHPHQSVYWQTHKANQNRFVMWHVIGGN